MDSLFGIIDARAQKKIDTAPIIKTLRGTVVEIFTNNKVKVQLLDNDIQYIVPNLSGSPVIIGEVVNLYYKGNVITETTAWVGAAKYKSPSNIITGSGILGELLTAKRRIFKIRFSNEDSKVVFVLNANIQGSSADNGTGRLYVSIDGVEESYKPFFGVAQSSYENVSLSLPLNIDIGNHILTVEATGQYATLIGITGYVFGYVSEYVTPYTPTSDEDYIWNDDEDGVNVLMYIGDTTSPEMPDMINGENVKRLTVTAFNYSNVEGVFIPDGIEQIE